MRTSSPMVIDMPSPVTWPPSFTYLQWLDCSTLTKQLNYKKTADNQANMQFATVSKTLTKSTMGNANIKRGSSHSTTKSRITIQAIITMAIRRLAINADNNLGKYAHGSDWWRWKITEHLSSSTSTVRLDRSRTVFATEKKNKSKH